MNDINNLSVPIRQYTTRKLVGISEHETIQKACQKMVEFRVGSLVVCNEEVVGFLTQGDVIGRVVAEGLSYSKPVSSIMTRHLITADIDSPVSRVLELMQQHQIRHVLITEHGQITGLFSLKDLVDPEKQLLETVISRE
ncbi:MAG: CBS domain-containing protein [Theionarchaea archaeon]|nr:CBS domain-containing protein [Theionarchaea archaeon]MBU6999740.1 CBS domain-containing protein [Theionarchaea archaeon]MBU7020161.1 CBS domain-containing protein [Theionarchaea archaeon]MBU7033722.1 CBS domain-containing protein [Theionarchaea archaeon]MBU7039967.1 CBS domain-containing protein [Theionarchaea archaeon]